MRKCFSGIFFLVGMLVCNTFAAAASPSNQDGITGGMVPFSVSDGVALVSDGRWTTAIGSGALLVCKENVINTNNCGSWLNVEDYVKQTYPQSRLVGFQLRTVRSSSIALVLYLKTVK